MDDGGGGASEADTGGAGAAREAGAGSLREPSTARAGAAVSRAGAGSPRDASTAMAGASAVPSVVRASATSQAWAVSPCEEAARKQGAAGAASPGVAGAARAAAARGAGAARGSAVRASCTGREGAARIVSVGGAASTAAGCTGLDTNTSYLLKIKLLGNRKKARKDVKCFSFDMVVDSNLSNYMDFVESIVDKYPPGYLEVAHIQYYDHVLKTFPKVNSDRDLMYMFDMHNKEKVVDMFIIYSDPSETFEPITEWDFGGEEQPDRTCSCRQWDVSGIPCKHALAFITSLTNEPIEKHVDLYYSIEKFRAAYSALIPALPDKSQWTKSEHGFFMHPPLLKAVAGRPKTERHKGCSDNKRKKGQHQCPICKDYGHHWHNCKKGSKEDIEAMKAVRGPPKKRKNAIVSDQSSIMALEDEAPAASMSFPPSQNLEATTTKKRKHANLCSEASKSSQSMEISSNKKGKLGNSNSAGSKRSRSGSNQPEGLSIGEPEGVKKGKGKRKKVISKKTPKKKLVLDSPAMGTRSKMVQPASPAMSTRSKRRLSL